MTKPTIVAIFISLLVPAVLLQAQCIPSGMVDWNDFEISNITIDGDNSLAEINNSSGSGASMYSDYTGISVDMTAGNSYNFSFQNAKETWGDITMRAWIDYLGDGTYVQVYDAGSHTNNGMSSQTFTGSFTISPSALPGTAVLRIAASYCSTCGGNGGVMSTDGCNFIYRTEVEDYTINITQTTTNPISTNDALSVIMNSTSGVTNQLNVGANDYIGLDGGDSDDYSISALPSNGTLVELSDGVFEYVPALDFLGLDSFSYTICDTNGDCAIGTANINVSLGSCIPTTVSNGTNYITNFTLVGDTGTINNSSGDNGGYGNFLHLNPADLTKGISYTGTINVAGSNMGWAIYIDYNKDGDFGDFGELVADTNGEGTGSLLFTVSNVAAVGNTVMRVGSRRYWSSNVPCGNTSGNPEEFEDYVVNIKNDPLAAAIIDVEGNGVLINLGAIEPGLANNTDFGLFDINAGASTKSFRIINNGSNALTLLGTPSVQVLNAGDGTYIDFYISDFPDNLTIASGASETFDVAFDPSSIGAKQAIISIPSNDPSTPLFQFTIQGEGNNTYIDTDKDGITDNIDLDDDNDGLTDSYENSVCLSYGYAGVTDVLLLNEDFGAGTTRTQIATLANSGTSYCYEDGFGANCGGVISSINLDDGEYTIHHTVCNGDGFVDADIDVDIASWAEDYWYTGPDHTTGDVNGRMAIINATTDPGVFYANVVNGVTTNVDVNYSVWALNIDRSDAPNVATRNRPQIAIKIYDAFNNLITQQLTAELQPTNVANPNGDWVELSGTFTSPNNTFTFVLVNVQVGGLGNDLAIDDIVFTQSLCDLDYDGIADVIDLDNDNDGIPNVVELQLQDNDLDATVFNDNVNIWVDVNNNGVHDAYEGVTPVDTDGDGVPDYLDLDSDNDGVFDSLEYNGIGEVDISGNGIGDGTDRDDFNPSTAQDGDGLLAIIDLNDDGVGNDHGSFNYPAPMDTDGDLIPDYLDVFSEDPTNNPANGSDISNTIYSVYDANNDGVIDGTTDSDSDGILDAFDSDSSNFGSPRDLDQKYTLYFDGRNDYVEDAPILGGLSDASLMAWIKIDTDAVGERVILGQSNFLVSILNDGSLRATANGINLNYTTAIAKGIWVHIAAIHNNSTNAFALYVNGSEVNSITTVSALSADITNFTIGRTPNTNTNYFKGEIDEVRVFNAVLTTAELQKMVYQELDDGNVFNSGAVIPLDVQASLGSSLLRYFKMDTYKGDILDDKTTLTIDQGTGAKMYNIKNVYYQTAPLPYVTNNDGDWSDSGTWLNGDVWDISDEANNKAWSIVEIRNNVTTSFSHKTLGLFVEANKELEINNGSVLVNSWYLSLDGLIDLEGESQLIQTENSKLIVGVNGEIQKDQQGTENLYTYNYFSSPVHSSNPNVLVDGDEVYTVEAVMNDGTNPAAPQTINFVGGYDGSNATTPIQVSSYWIWKFDNRPVGDYAEWQQVLYNGNLKVGEGYTMKGPGTGLVSNSQNYTFIGKPNNGDIALTSNAGSNYLVGNPYPSAIDAYEFITDNPHLSGTLYFWEHFGGGSHNTAEYQGGYGLYNLSGGTPPIDGTQATSSVGLDLSGTAVKTPRRYIPVAQGFFVEAITSGAVKFENDQRIFVTETGNTNSWFLRNDAITTETVIPEDLRPKFRFGYSSPEGYYRQLLLTVDPNASVNYDWGYDGEIITINEEDMYWDFNNKKYIIQGLDATLPTTILPISVKAKYNGIIEINIDSLENVDESVNIYLKDNNIYHDLRGSQYITTVSAGITANRFEIVFAPSGATLSNQEFQANNQLSLFVNNGSICIISNPNALQITSVEVINMLGQIVLKRTVNSNNNRVEMPVNLQTGAYIFNIEVNGIITSKKLIVSAF